MVSNTRAYVSVKRDGVPSAPGYAHRRLLGRRPVGESRAAADDDFRFLRHVRTVIETQTDLVKRSILSLAESRELLTRINDLLRR